MANHPMIGWLCAVIRSSWGWAHFQRCCFLFFIDPGVNMWLLYCELLSFIFSKETKRWNKHIFPAMWMFPLLDSAILTLNMLNLPQISISVSFRALVVLLDYFFSCFHCRNLLLVSPLACTEELQFVSSPHYINYFWQQWFCSCVNRFYLTWQEWKIVCWSGDR